MRKQYLLKVFYNLIYYVFSQGSTFFLTFYLVKAIDKTSFGAYAMILNTAVLIGGISDLGMGGMASRFLAEFQQINIQRASRILRMCILVSFVSSLFVAFGFAISSNFIDKILFDKSSYFNEVLMSSFVILTFALNTTFTGILIGLGKFTELAKIAIIGGVSYLLFPILLMANFQITGLIWGVALSYIIQLILMIRSVVGTEVFKFNISGTFTFLQERSLVITYGLPAIIGGFLSMFGLWSLQYNILRAAHSTDLIADFNVAISLKTIVLMIPAVISSVSLNFLNSILGENSKNYKNAFKFSNSITVWTTLILALLFFIFGKQILLLFGKQYQSNYFLLGILMLATIPESITISRSQILTSEKKVWQSFFLINLPRDIFIFFFIGSIIIGEYGIYGACVTYLIARVYSMIAVFFMTNKSRLLS